ncbi:MAG: dynamin family protein, partial [Synergistales bacterium]|nr:dynamin family protein [Synergistales bacterium]
MTGSSVAAQEVLSDLLDRSRRSLGRWEERCGDAGRSLEELQERLRSGRFHLAVLGQFKRGKSTLLNALLGADLLPTAVLPLTAIPTLIRWGDVSAAEVRFLDGDRKERLSGSVGELRAFLVRYVSEKENPENRLDVKEVEIAYPSPLLQRGVVLIDTPGIGSTFRHNTETTLGFLSQCDAALFVLSADPPPTEAELAFLDQVRANVPHLVFVLNKVDYLAPEEAGEVERFLRDLLTEKAGIDGETPIFPLSAKKALEARKRGDASLWEESGAETLRRHLIDFSVAEKERALIRALSGKASDIVADVLLSLKLELRSLR